MSEVIMRFDVPTREEDGRVFKTAVQFDVGGERQFVCIGQESPNAAEEPDYVLLDKEDVLRIADMLRGH